MITLNIIKSVGKNVSSETKILSDHFISSGLDGLEVVTGIWGNTCNQLLFNKFKLSKNIKGVDALVRYGKGKLGKTERFLILRETMYTPQNQRKPDLFDKYMKRIDRLVESGKATMMSFSVGDTEYIFSIGQFTVTDVACHPKDWNKKNTAK